DGVYTRFAPIPTHACHLTYWATREIVVDIALRFDHDQADRLRPCRASARTRRIPSNCCRSRSRTCQSPCATETACERVCTLVVCELPDREGGVRTWGGGSWRARHVSPALRLGALRLGIDAVLRRPHPLRLRHLLHPRCRPKRNRGHGALGI